MKPTVFFLMLLLLFIPALLEAGQGNQPDPVAKPESGTDRLIRDAKDAIVSFSNAIKFDQKAIDAALKDGTLPASPPEPYDGSCCGWERNISYYVMVATGALVFLGAATFLVYKVVQAVVKANG